MAGRWRFPVTPFIGSFGGHATRCRSTTSARRFIRSCGTRRKNRRGPATPRYTSGERLSQVWFAGVHANVGGGYPDDSLAQIPLYWIVQEAKACGLTFKPANPEAMAETRRRRTRTGGLYDSREGLRQLYRYGPRRLARLCNELFSRTLKDEVSIAAPKIHE